MYLFLKPKQYSNVVCPVPRRWDPGRPGVLGAQKGLLGKTRVVSALLGSGEEKRSSVGLGHPLGFWQQAASALCQFGPRALPSAAPLDRPKVGGGSGLPVAPADFTADLTASA